MLLGGPNLFTLPQSGKDAILSQQRPTSRPLDFKHFIVSNVSPRGDYIEVKVLSENNDASTVLQHVTG
jgi:hypothetical protein